MARSIFTTILSILILSNISLKLSFGIDTLLPYQTISFGQTLISHNQDFEMGFFSPGKSQNHFLGIWYKNTPDVVVWVANRNNPISHYSIGVTFSISGNGTLVITRNGSVLWSANSSEPSSNPILQLLDTGNLILVNETIKEGGYLWQSFDYPTDTWLPGMKVVDDPDAGVVKYLTSWRNLDDPSPGDFVSRIENQGLPELVTRRGKTKTFRNGKWNGLYFGGYPLFPNSMSKAEMVFRGERLISMKQDITLSPDNTTILKRGTIDTSGIVYTAIMNARKDKWNIVYSVPGDKCDEYGFCGPNGVCSFDKPIRCQCFKGFSPKFRNEWDLQDWSGGCTRIASLNCKSGDGFQEVRGVKYPDMLTFWLNMSMSLDECKTECLKNCSCTAYANPYIIDGGIGCVMWFGDLIDTRHLPGSDSKQNVYIRVPVSEQVDESPHLVGLFHVTTMWFGDLIDTRHLPGSDSKQNVYIRVPVSEQVDDSSHDLKREMKKPTRQILISIASGVIVSGFINGGIFMMRRPKKKAIKDYNEDLEIPLLNFATIVAATNNFSRENIIGEGGFGPVYKGILPSKEEIAVKRLSRTSGQGLEEFKNEATLIAKLQHTNLVRLLGCCIEGEERMLIYEFMHNKSLDYFVFDENQKKHLTWPNRFDVIMGIARGLLYLHHDSRLKIIHRDFKTSNILLDGNLNPKISDFGLARTFGEDKPVSNTKKVVGTYGYMAPEYVNSGKFSVKTDVFSLGVVLLEIVSGKKNRGFESSDDYCHSLLGHAWLLWKENRAMELMDECLNGTCIESEVKRCIHVGLLCVQKFAEDRPVMSSVLFMLGTDEAILPEPKEPAFFISERSSISSSLISERNTITISDMEAR